MGHEPRCKQRLSIPENGRETPAQIWLGSAKSTDWSTSGNWSENSTPGASNNVIIPDLASDPVISSDPASPATCDKLNIEPGAVLTIDAGKALTVNDVLDNDGTLAINSTSSGTGSLIMNSTLSNSGTISVQRYIEGFTGNNDGWHLLSSPVETFTIDGSAFDPGSADDLFRWEETTGYWMNHKAGDPTQITPGTGYLTSWDNTDTKTFSGDLNNSDIEKNNLSFTDASSSTGWHLLGNPFPCALQWNPTSGSGWEFSNIGGTAKIMNSGGSYSDIAADAYIPSSQGFLVYVSSGTNSITIPKANRVHDATTPWFKEAEVNKIKLTAYDPAGNKYQETIIRFSEDATHDFDLAYDSWFMAGYAPMLYTSIENKAASTNSLPRA